MESNSIQAQNNFQNVRKASSDAGARGIIAFLAGILAFGLFSIYSYPRALVLGGATFFLVFMSVILNQEYERAVVFRLGAFSRVFGAGLNFKVPFLEWVQKVDYRVKTVNVHPQKVLTKDNVTVTVDAIVFYKVRRNPEDIKKSILEVEDFNKVTVNYGQTMLRAMIGKKELDEILQNRDKIADELRKELDKATNDFGVHIRDVEIQDVSIPQSMERAMAAEAEAERDRRARITHAEGELQAAARTRLASDILGDAGYKLRTLQTLDEVATENSTVVTIPAELMPGKTTDEETGDVQGILDNLRDSIDMDELIGGAEETITDKEGSK